MLDGPLDGTVALVTGADVDVGSATARRLAREGAAIALIGADRDRLAAAVGVITSDGGHGVAVEADITDQEQAARAVSDTLDRFGRLDVLINGAGVALRGTALRTTLGEWDRMIALNLSALVHLTHAALPHLIDAVASSPRQVADIVNIGSVAGRIAHQGGSVYHLTRFGLAGFTESLRQELVTDRVRVGIVEPGEVGCLDDAARDAALRPDEIADAIAYMVGRGHRVAVNEILVRATRQIW
ncbi:SDR family NAD(P)-dependent oxidoreductase [Cryptosporangium aurantiacum]|uniref:NADP-dependent 3-hydroxy acid dehydrogenase YdfG n=1 Tax=Cryptosporangium aurantiacum TaxID=134849 RepID=A0A1M7Q8M7_9ACTN|nr:SDR family NAD(P)-dependent oxidoreductase [Cryptosporangium aurantiacum]SHN26624.1 NADP-dependent 3-hydroxy acid dehydrogenase YdfG [Cryptosporangium aurantiacum]